MHHVINPSSPFPAFHTWATKAGRGGLGTDDDVWFKADTSALQLIAKHMNLNHFREVYLSDVSVNQQISTTAVVSTGYM